MLVIRLFRVGKKNQPSFKIVVTDKRNPPRGGRFVEEVGFYNPRTKEKIIKKERIQYWLGKGVKPSATVYNLLVKEGILEGAKIPVHKKPKKKPASAEAPSAADSASVAKATSAKEAAPEGKPAGKEAAPEGGEPRPESSGREKPAEAPKEEKPKKESSNQEEAPKKETPKEETPKESASAPEGAPADKEKKEELQKEKNKKGL